MIGTHRDNAQFSRARWRKSLLLPCWIAQILLLLGIMGLFSYRLSRTVRTWEEEEGKGEMPLVEFIWECVNIAFSLISLIITLASVAKFIAEALTPLPLLFSNILSATLSGAVLALDIVVYVQHADRQYSLIGLAMDCTLMFFILVPTFYSVIIYRRLLAYDDYHLPGNFKPYGFANPSEPEDTAYRSSYLSPPTPYDPTNPSATANTRPRSLSAGRRISLTFSRGVSPTPQIAATPSPEATPNPADKRPLSYDHKRDTQFDDYVNARRSSGMSAFSRDVERALDPEFWDDVRSATASGSGSGAGSGVVGVGAGVVAAGQARPRGNSLPRQMSLEASLSGVSSSGSATPATSATGSVDTMVARAHSLVSVPEAHEEEDHAKRLGSPNARSWKKQATEEREGLLLGGDGGAVSRNSSGSGASSRRIDPVEEELEEIELDNRKRRRES
ncbi:hypothetical protein F5B20DRAFT_344469 [Whalleya microplaca]|nr:hypothetical protein F5B20DRAFT_344469 [Whalleya microplaca]